MIHLYVLAWFSGLYKKCLKYRLPEKKYLVWGIGNFLFQFILIILNPGIESPKFFWSYLIFAGITLGLFFRTEEKLDKLANVENNE